MGNIAFQEKCLSLPPPHLVLYIILFLINYHQLKLVCILEENKQYPERFRMETSCLTIPPPLVVLGLMFACYEWNPSVIYTTNPIEEPAEI